MSVHQKLGMILVIKWFKIDTKNCLKQKMVFKLIFSNNFFFNSVNFLTSKYDFGTFCETVIHGHKKNPLEYFDF